LNSSFTENALIIPSKPRFILKDEEKYNRKSIEVERPRTGNQSARRSSQSSIKSQGVRIINAPG
jgi:hypothetical protein